MILTCIFLLPAGVKVFAQPFTRLLNKIPVYDSEVRIPNTFSGGHNNIEHQFVDIDGDGDLDLIYLDSDGTYGWYENTGDKFNPHFILSFDTIPGMKFSDWFYFIDIDDDGDFDIFTGGAAALIEFRMNTGSAASPFFTLEIDTVLDNNGDFIFSEFGCNPVFIDIDGDGDYDFLSGNSIGTITFYENIGDNINFNFKFITNFWQDILIIGGALKTELHGASSLDFIDIDNDGDYDLFWGDFFSRSLYLIENKGTSTSPDMKLMLNSYPPNQDSVWTSGFNMPRFADIDNDNDYDLLVSVLYDPTVPQSLIFYRNDGTVQIPDFIKVTENYIKTLDVGIQSVLSFMDIDGDGDLDLFIGCAKSPRGTIHYFENTGSADNPSFLLTDSAYFNIEGDLTIAPAFGDLDNDGEYDLLIGEFLGRISYYENTGSKFSPNFVFREQIKDSNGSFISAGNVARPFLIDINNNGLLDIVIGGFNGRLTLYRNIGTPENYLFKKDSLYFAIISLPDTILIDVGSYSAPFLTDYNNNGKLELFTGGSGNIFFYRNNGTTNQPVWELVTDKFLSLNFGTDAIPFFVDIDNDGDIDLFTGNYKGGLYYFENDLITNLKEEQNTIYNYLIAEAYPNPFNNNVKISINIPQSDEVTISIYNILGEKIKDLYSGYLNAGRNHFFWDGKNEINHYLSSGSYFVFIKTSEQIKAIKILYLK